MRNRSAAIGALLFSGCLFLHVLLFSSVAQSAPRPAGVSLAFLRTLGNGDALVMVVNTGERRSRYTLSALYRDGAALKPSFSSQNFVLGRGKQRKVKVSGLPRDDKGKLICASVRVDSSLSLQSCAAVRS